MHGGKKTIVTRVWLKRNLYYSKLVMYSYNTVMLFGDSVLHHTLKHGLSFSFFFFSFLRKTLSACALSNSD